MHTDYNYSKIFCCQLLLGLLSILTAVVVTTGAIKRANLQSNRDHQHTNTHFLQAGCRSCHQTNSVRALPSYVKFYIFGSTSNAGFGTFVYTADECYFIHHITENSVDRSSYQC